MKQISQIVKQDLRNLKRVPLVALLLVGLAFLPSLYAWFNVAASWDPYSNTGQIKVAVVNEDAGAEVNGEQFKVGDELVENLKRNDKMGWTFVDRATAEEGVKKGDYYASVYISKDFSEKLTSVLDGEPAAPEVRYTVNEKLNAIAPKMTSAGASAIVEEISEQFLGEASTALFTELNDIGVELENELPTIRKIESNIFKLEERFPEINELGEKVLELQNDWPVIKEKVESVIGMDEHFSDINEAAGYVLEIEERLPEIHTLSERLAQLEERIPEIEAAADKLVEIGSHFGEVEAQIVEALEIVQTAQEAIGRAQEALPHAAEMADHAQGYLEGAKEVLNEVEGAIDPLVDVINRQASFVEQGANAVETALSDDSSGALVEQLRSANEVLAANGQALTQAIDFLSELNEPLPGKELSPAIDSLSEARDKTNSLQESVQSAIATLEAGGELDSQTVESLKEQAQATAQSAQHVQQYMENGGADVIKGAVSQLGQAAEDAGDDLAAAEERLPDLEEMLNQASAISVTGEEQLNNLLEELPAIEERVNEAINLVENGLPEVIATIKGINAFMSNDFPAIEERIHEAADFIRDDLPSLEEEFSEMAEKVEEALPEFEEALNHIATFVDGELPGLEETVGEAADRIREFEENTDLEEMIGLLKNDIEKESAFFAEPVKLIEDQLYAVPNYGSANAPFYTALSLWVGALLLANLLKTDVHPVDMREEYKAHHIYLGRLVLFLLVGFFQALIVSIGDLLVLGVYAAHPVWFVVFSVLVGSVFMTIVYTLVSVFGNIGKALAIIFMVLQLSGAGGTFPIQVAPPFFQAIHPFLPFTYAINLLREAVGGIVAEAVWINIGVLVLFLVLALLFGLLLKKPLAERMQKTTEKSRSSRMID